MPDPKRDRFLGSKAASGAYQAIIATFPPHDTYIEPFLGSGAVMRRKPPARLSIGIEKDPAVHSQTRRSMGPGETRHICGDAFEWLRWLTSPIHPDLGRVLIYCDPPYLHATRRSSRYRYEFSDADHQRLCELLVAMSPQASIAVSGYPSSRYDDWLPGWRSIEFQVMSHIGPRTEKLWMNYDVDAVHWASYAGRNFTDRQRIKRKAERWGRNYQALPAGERLAILARILQTHASMHPGAESDTSMRALQTDPTIGAGGEPE